MIYDKTNAFCKEMRRNLACGGAVELRKLYLAITTDTLSAHCFENSLDLLKDDRRANDWKKTIRAVAVLTPLIKQFTWIISIALRLPLGLLQMLVPDLARIVALRRVGRTWRLFGVIHLADNIESRT